MPEQRLRRSRELRQWCKEVLAQQHPAALAKSSWHIVTGDASTRHYYRLQTPTASWICMDAPPATEKNAAFLQVRALLEQQGIEVPALVAVDQRRGFLLLGDLGDQLLLSLLDAATVDHYYAMALDTLRQMQCMSLSEAVLPAYSPALLEEELQRFPDWFCSRLLQVELSPAVGQMLSGLNQLLIASAMAQPSVFVHRDYHSRNLLYTETGKLGVIDFQDAVLGPLCYDLVSLLRDCYVCWPPEKVQQWALAYLQQLQQAGLCPAVEPARFLRWFDWMGLQRHLKVLGNFARLAVRDGRPQYLDDLPLVLHYVMQVLDSYAEFADCQDWFNAELQPRIAAQSWSDRA